MHCSSYFGRSYCHRLCSLCSVTAGAAQKKICLNQPKLTAVLWLAGLNSKLKLMPTDACDSRRLIVILCRLQMRLTFGLGHLSCNCCWNSCICSKHCSWNNLGHFFAFVRPYFKHNFMMYLFDRFLHRPQTFLVTVVRKCHRRANTSGFWGNSFL